MTEKRGLKNYTEDLRMRKIKDCYKKAANGRFCNKGDFFVGRIILQIAISINHDNQEIAFSQYNPGIILDNYSPGQNYRRINSDKDAKHQS